MKTAFYLFCLFASLSASAGETGPHGGVVVQDADNKFEVKLDQDAKVVSVYTLGGRKDPPKSMAITLFREGGDGNTIDLKAIDFKPGLPRFQGELGPNAGSIAGVELRFETSLKALRVLKLIPYIPRIERR